MYHGHCKFCGIEFTSDRKYMYCRAHKNATLRKQSLKPRCKQCGSELPPYKRTFCSDECLKRYHNPEQYVLTEDIVKARVAERYEHIEHVSGHESDGVMIVRCKKCGYEFTINERASRVTRLAQCRKCRDRERRKALQEKKKQKAIDKLILVLKKHIGRHYTCQICGKVYIPSNDGSTYRYCSDQCRNKAERKAKHVYNKKRRAKYNGSKDNICGDKLYDIENGVCYLCGICCDYDDYVIINGSFTAGENYPTIDHIVPLAKGGKHEWNNVRLACMRCNREKGDRLI